ncbi:MAG: efflux RND transporter permease subunit [Bacteroidia bacterium]|nr:efflux RND transporter permease subunit [Bacteroidia bacterium]
MSISEIAIKRPSLIIVLFAVLTLLGVFGYQQLSYELLPKFSAPVVVVSTVYPGASPAEVENTITKPIEDAVSGMEKMANIRSTSRENLSVVVVEMEVGADIDKALQNAERLVNLAAASLPEDAQTPVLSKFAIDELPVIQMVVTSNLEQIELYDLIQNRIVPSMARVPGVAQIDILGGQEREIRINVNPEKLERYNLSILQVSQALEAANLDFPTGKLKDETRQVLIRLSGKFQSVDDIRHLIVTRDNRTGAPVFLHEIADIQDTQKDVTQIARLNGQNSIALSVRKNTEANGVALSEAMYVVIAELEKTYESQNVKFSIAQDASVFTLEAAEAVTHDIGLAIFLVAIVMLVFLHSLRNAFIVMLAIPASLVSTFFVMYMFGFSLNLMTLLAISLVVGILVDDSIVVLENIFRHLEMGKDQRTAALEGRSEIAFTALSITLVDVVVFLPLAFLEGLIANIMRQFALVVVFSTLMSLLVSFTLTPFLASRLSKVTHLDKNSIGGRVIYIIEGFIHALTQSYAHVLRWVLKHKTITMVISLVMILGALTLPATGLIGFEFAKTGDKGEFLLKLELNKQASLAQTFEVVRQVEDKLFSMPEVTKVYVNMGSSSNAFESSSGENFADITVSLKPPKETGIKTAEYSRALKLQLEQELPGVKVRIQELGLLGADQLPIMVIVSSAVPDSAYAYAERLRRDIANINGVVDPELSVQQGNPEMSITVNREKMSELGLTMGMVGATLQTAFAGTEATKFRDGDNEYDVTVKLDQFNRKSRTDIENLALVNNMGQQIRLSQFATVAEKTGPSQLERRNRMTSVVVQSLVLGRSVGAVGQDVIAKIAETKPAGIEIAYDSELKNTGESFGSLGLALLASFLLIYLILVALYDSYVYPFVVLFSIPVALIGAFLALALENMSIFSMLGLIMLLGLVAKNAILIVDFANQLKARGYRTAEALVIAGKARMRPILMTTIAMIIGMLPIALATGSGAEWKNGLAWALIGGLTSSLLLTVFVVPAAYMIMDTLIAWVTGRRDLIPRKQELDVLDLDALTIRDEHDLPPVTHTPSENGHAPQPEAEVIHQ